MANDLQFRVGHQVPALGGMRLDGQAGAIPPWMFHRAINVRFAAGGVNERGGQRKLNAEALEGCTTGIIPGDAVPTLFTEVLYTLTADASPGADPGTAELMPWDPINGLGAVIGSGDHWANLQSTAGEDPQDAEETITISRRLSAVLGGDLNFDTEVDGNDVPDVQTVGASEGCCGGIAKLDDVWYQALVTVVTGTPNYNVYRVDPPGPTATLDRQFSGSPGGDSQTRVWLAHYEERDELLAALEPGALHRKSAAGVWTRIPLPTSCTINRNHLANWAELDGLFYFSGFGPGGGHLLYEYDGAVIVPFHSWAGAPGTYSPLTVHEGSLYFALNAGGTIKLGRYGGAGTTISVVSTFAGAAEVRQLLTAFGRLFAFRGDTLESSLAPESAPFAVVDPDGATAGAYQAGGRRRAR
jgi:hypothetical protein